MILKTPLTLSWNDDPYHKKTIPLTRSGNQWTDFQYDRDLPHERVIKGIHFDRNS